MKHFKTVGKNIRRSPYQAIIAILVMTLTVFMITLFSFLTLFSVKFINFVESKPQLAVVFKLDAKSDEINKLKKQLEDTGKTALVTHVTKEEGLKIYKEQNKSYDPILLDLVSADILPDILDVKATKAEDLTELAQIAGKSSQVDNIMFQRDLVDKLTSWLTTVRKIGIGVIAVLLIETIFVIITIISMKIIVRREEIETVKLLGASNWFVRIPFIYEGMFYGFIGSLFGFILSLVLLLYFAPFIESSLQGVPLFPIPYLTYLEIFAVETLFACFWGALASFFVVLRYLK